MLGALEAMLCVPLCVPELPEVMEPRFCVFCMPEALDAMLNALLCMLEEMRRYSVRWR